MRIELVKRPQPSLWFSAVSPLIALLLAMICGAILFALMGKDPFAALHAFFIEPLLDIWSIHELMIKAAPLILIAVGLSFCYISNNWNIGAEGQLTMGAIAGSVLPVMYPDVQGWYVLPVMMLMGIAGGAAYGAVPAFLKVRFNANPILTSLMLVYVAQFFLDWLVRGIWRNPEGNNFPETRQFSEAAVLPEIWPAAGRAHWGLVFALIAAFVLWFVLHKTLKGFEIKVTGQSPRAGRFAGFSAGKVTFFVFLLSGGLAGLAGISEVSGAIGQLRTTISPGYGFTAIIIAFLGRLNPIGIIAAGFVLALSYLGGEAAQLSIGISEKSARVFQGMILFFVLACDTFIHYRIHFSGKKHNLSGEA